MDTQDYDRKEAERQPIVGVDFGVKELAVLSNGERIPANQKLKANMRRLKRRNKRLSRKQSGSNRRLKAKVSLARLHQRIANQRQAALHELSDRLTRTFDTIVIEDLNVKGMVKNRRLSRTVSDAGFSTLRQQIEHKAELRSNTVVLADRFYPSTKACSDCGYINPAVVPGVETWACPDCGSTHDRDLNAAINLERHGLHTLAAAPKRAQEDRKTASAADLVTV